MLSVAAGIAIVEGADAVAYAAHAGDHAIYPDCRKEFVQALAATFPLCDWHKLDLLAPFVDKTKAEIAAIGKALGVPFELTWSCYQGGEVHCGRCGTCCERLEAMEQAGVDDRTQYLDKEFWRQASVNG